MSNNSDKPFRFRVSLRGLFLALLVLGAGFGILGRLLRQNPQMFAAVVGALSTVVPYVLAVGTILWIGGRRRQYGLLVWGICLIVLPFVGFGTIALTQMFVGTSPSNLRTQTTANLIDQQLPKQLDAPWVWRELEQRLAAGNLSQEEAESAVGKLIANMRATKPEGWDQPLSWQRDFLASAEQAGLLSDEVITDLADAFYGPTATIRPLPRLRQVNNGFEIEIDYGSSWGEHSTAVPALLWQVDRVLLDGQPVKVEQLHRHGTSWSGGYEGTVAMGEHEVICEVTCAYVDQAKLIGLDPRRLPSARWPKAIKQWTQTISAPLTVFNDTESLVKLTTDASLDPSGGIRVKRCVIQADQNSTKKVIVELDLGAAVSMSWDVSIVLAGSEVPLGARWVAISENRQSSGGNMLSAKIESLDPLIEIADIRLTPAPEHVEHRPEVKEIWGKQVTLFSVPIERLDLEVESESDSDE